MLGAEEQFGFPMCCPLAVNPLLENGVERSRKAFNAEFPVSKETRMSLPVRLHWR